MFSFNKSPKVIGIMGATGAQGGAVVRAFNTLKEGGNSDYFLRAITRDPTSEKAQTIAPLVDEVVQADAKDKASIMEAFKGCYGVYIVLNFWEDMNVENEMLGLRNCKEALKEIEDVEHIVLSSLEGPTKDYVNKTENKDTWVLPKGYEELGMYVPHQDGKQEVEVEFLNEDLPVTPLYTSFYYENFIYFGMGPSRQSESDPYAITLPIGDVKLPMVAVADIGKAACAIFQDKSLIGKTVGIMGENLSGKEIADTFAKICGEEVLFNAVPWNIYASFGFPGAEELANMFRYNVETVEEFTSIRVASDKMKDTMGRLISLESWVTENKSAFKLVPKEGAPSAEASMPVQRGETQSQDVCCRTDCSIM